MIGIFFSLRICIHVSTSELGPISALDHHLVRILLNFCSNHFKQINAKFQKNVLPFHLTPENMPFGPKRKRKSIPTIHLQVRNCSFQGGSDDFFCYPFQPWYSPTSNVELSPPFLSPSAVPLPNASTDFRRFNTRGLSRLGVARTHILSMKYIPRPSVWVLNFSPKWSVFGG